MRSSTPLLCCAIIAGNTLFGQSGVLDASWGTAGTTIGNYELNSVLGSIAVQTDGKVLAAGRYYNPIIGGLAVVRYDPDGSLDDTFSGDGIELRAVIGLQDICGIAVQPDGKILVCGTVSDNFYLTRINTDGSTDPNFGTDGVVTLGASGSGILEAKALCLQTDGKILVAGDSDIGGAMARFLPDGMLDPDFGSSTTPGFITIGGIGDFTAVWDATVQPDGKILLAGQAGTPLQFVVSRFLADGTQNDGPNFGQFGGVLLPFGTVADRASAVELQPDGKILVAGTVFVDDITFDFGVARLNTDGSLDQSFGSAGKATSGSPAFHETCTSMVLQPDGKILLGGYAGNGDMNDLMLVRYYADGVRDNGFGTDGVVITNVQTNDRGESLALQPDGKIIMGGTTYITNEDFVLVRYLNTLTIGLVEFGTIGGSTLVYPTPLSDQATLSYELKNPGSLSCELFDAQGRMVRSLFSNAKRMAGSHRETLDVSCIAAGKYTLVLSDGSGRTTVNVVKQ
ncbi:MAG: T9SS type A sorting domain-containing protein [Flavobacteriales bacterium]|nr:T9SS type A sorting domain-containing protein [Flavobacteriales bacterium]